MEIISVDSLVKDFKSLRAVDNISFSVSAGEIFAFLGPNGAGKTTTIKMLTTLLEPTSGKMVVNSFGYADKMNIRKSIGIVFQDSSIDDELTAIENMEFHGALYGLSKALRTKRIHELLQMVELWDRKDDLVKHFSGGMRRRLEIARSLMHHPKIIFLDEPTQGLDPQTRNRMWDYVRELNKNEGVTIFFTTHYMEEAEKIAQRIAIMDHGKIMIIGKLDEILKKARAKTLEDAFLNLTGRTIRADDNATLESMRRHSKLWKGRK